MGHVTSELGKHRASTTTCCGRLSRCTLHASAQIDGLKASCGHVGASAGPSATAAEEALKLLPGAYFDVQQGIDEHGLPIDSPVDTKSSEPGFHLALCVCVCMLSALKLCPWL